jgi:hypothetical protein
VDKIVGILLEEERRFAVGIVAHLDGVGGIIAPDAVNPADWERLFRIHHR